MPQMAPEGSAPLGIGALVPQGAGLADFAPLVLEGLTMAIVARPWQPLPPGTEIDVVLRVIGEGLIRKPAISLVAVFEGRDMRLEAPVMTFQIILDRAVLGIRHHHLYLALRILRMLLNQLGKQMALINRPGSHLGGGDDFGLLSTARCTLKESWERTLPLLTREASGSVVDR